MKKVLTITISILVYISIFSSFVHATLNKDDSFGEDYIWVEVEKGDTLWDIADRYNDEQQINIHRMLDFIIKLNQLESTLIHAGQRLKVPFQLK